MKTLKNRQFKLAARPDGLPKDSDWEYCETAAQPPEEGQVLVQTHFISLDPAMRGWMNEGKSYIRPVELGDVMRAGAVGKVLASRDSNYKAGDFVTGPLGVQEYATLKGKSLAKIREDMAPLPTYLATLGMPGLTAYFGLLDVGQPKAGETVVVSGAAGAVGSVVGQIAKIKGCQVIGIAGGPEKCSYLTEALGFDGAIDYKNEDLKEALKRNCPDGIDVYFDNVGGPTLDTVLKGIRLKARIIICGAISQYNNTEVVGPANYLSLLVNRARMEGIVVFDYQDQYQQALVEMGTWMAQGKLGSKVHIVKGIEQFPEALNMLFAGKNFGKLVLQVQETSKKQETGKP